MEAQAPSPEVILALRAKPKLAQEAREQRLVDTLRRGVFSAKAPAQALHSEAKLAVERSPLPHPQIRQELALQRLAKGGGGQRFSLHLQPAPQGQQGEEIGALIPPLGVGLVRSLLLIRGSVPYVGLGQPRDNGQHGLEHVPLLRRHEHAPKLGIQRKFRQRPAHGGQAPEFIEGLKLLQQTPTVRQGLRLRGLKEGKGFRVPEVQLLHAEHHGGEVRAANLRIGKRGARLEIGRLEEAEAHPWSQAPAAARALGGAGLGNRLHGQTLKLRAIAVAGNSGQPAIDDVADTRHGQGGFRDVRGQHDAPRAPGIKDSLLVRIRKPGIEGQHLCAAEGLGIPQHLGRIANISLPRQKYEHVPSIGRRRLALSLQAINRLQSGKKPLLHPPLLREGQVFHGNREGASRNLNDRRWNGLSILVGFGEVRRKALQIDGGRSDDELEIGTPGQQPREVPQKEVDIQAALMGLIDDQAIIGTKLRVPLRFR